MSDLCVVEPLDTFITPSPITRFLRVVVFSGAHHLDRLCSHVAAAARPEHPPCCAAGSSSLTHPKGLDPPALGFCVGRFCLL